MDNRTAKHLYGIINYPSPLILRLLRGMCSQTKLGLILDVGQDTITSWETGKKEPSPDNFGSLMKHYMTWTRDLGWPGLELLIAARNVEEAQPQPAAETDTTPPTTL